MSTTPDPALFDRAAGAFYGLALGDALGMPTQVMSREDVVRVYGTLSGFEPARPDNPVSAGMPAGSVTDDTDQAVIVARLIVEGGGHVDPLRFAQELLSWEREMKAKGSFDLLGPSTKAALDALCLAQSIERNPNDLDAALERYDRLRGEFGRRCVGRARRLGAYIEARARPERGWTAQELDQRPERLMREVAAALSEIPELALEV